jgi:hypothetical protein
MHGVLGIQIVSADLSNYESLLHVFEVRCLSVNHLDGHIDAHVQFGIVAGWLCSRTRTH